MEFISRFFPLETVVYLSCCVLHFLQLAYVIYPLIDHIYAPTLSLNNIVSQTSSFGGLPSKYYFCASFKYYFCCHWTKLNSCPESNYCIPVIKFTSYYGPSYCSHVAKSWCSKLSLLYGLISIIYQHINSKG